MNELPTALIVDDEPLARLSLAEELEAAFNTVAVNSADEAIAVLEQRDDIRVVFTDAQMPGSMDGVELAYYIRERWPPTILVVTSGRHASEADLPLGAAFIAKPHQSNELALLVRDIRERLS